MTYDDMILDLKIMKECNVNSIRTAHYPKSPIFMSYVMNMVFML